MVFDTGSAFVEPSLVRREDAGWRAVSRQRCGDDFRHANWHPLLSDRRLRVTRDALASRRLTTAHL